MELNILHSYFTETDAGIQMNDTLGIGIGLTLNVHAGKGGACVVLHPETRGNQKI